MELELPRNRAASFIIAGTITIAVIGTLIFFDSQSEPFHKFLNSLTGHHWLTKSVIASALFFSLSAGLFFGSNSKGVRGVLKSKNIYVWSIALGAVTLVFFLLDFLTYIVKYVLH